MVEARISDAKTGSTLSFFGTMLDSFNPKITIVPVAFLRQFASFLRLATQVVAFLSPGMAAVCPLRNLRGDDAFAGRLVARKRAREGASYDTAGHDGIPYPGVCRRLQQQVCRVLVHVLRSQDQREFCRC